MAREGNVMTCGGVYCSAKLNSPFAKYSTDDTRADFFSPGTGFNCICAKFDWKPVDVKFFGREVVRFYVTTNNNLGDRLRSPLRGQRNWTWIQIHKGRKLGLLFFKKGSISTSEGSVVSRGWDLIAGFFLNISEKISKTKHLNDDDDNGLVTMIGAGELFHICVTVCVC